MLKLVFLTIFYAILLTGCATNLPKTVDIPVPVACPKPQIPPKPILPIATLQEHDKPDVVMKAYVASIKLLNGYTAELTHILQSYQN